MADRHDASAGALGPQHGVHHLRLTRVAAPWAVRAGGFHRKEEVAQEVASASPKTTRKQLPAMLDGGPCAAVVFSPAGRRWAEGAYVSRRTVNGARMSTLQRVQKVRVVWSAPSAGTRDAPSGRKKKGVRAGRTWGGPCGARPWSSGSYGSGVHRHACGRCARARGRRGWGKLRGAIFDMWVVGTTIRLSFPECLQDVVQHLLLCIIVL